MFWGLVLEPSKKYTQKVDQTFHISQAALDLNSYNTHEPVQLVVEYENSSFVLATLSKKANIFQVPLDLIFKTGDQVSFRTIGHGKVHLSGYHVLEDLDSMIMNGEEESDLDEVKEMDKGKGKRKKEISNSKGGKRLKLDDTNEDGTDEDDESDDSYDIDDSDEDSEDEQEGQTIQKKNIKKKQKSDSSLVSMDDEEEEDEDDEDDEDDEEDDIEMDEEEDDEEMEYYDTDEEDEKGESEVKPKISKPEGKKSPQTPNGMASSAKGKDKSSQNKSIQQGTPANDKKTPKSETKQKGEKNVKSTESTPQRKNEEKTAKSPKPEGSPQKKVLEGGVISEELRVGNGPVAKPGKMANVYYIGTLGSTKKQFDSVQSGSGFKFRVGRNEVIKGWDIGVIGMKVGGKRRLTIPPHLAYGSKGSPPVIPPNSTLVFTIELKGLS